jgi:hypothetical protein
MTDSSNPKSHYLDNKEFARAVVEYSQHVKLAKENQQEIPVVTDYIARCFLRMAEGLSHRPNFAGYSYRDEMVMDGVMASLKAVTNFNPEATTRSGLPNAFGYFTQIMFYAFLQRIAKEKKQQDVKMKLLHNLDVTDLVTMDGFDGSSGVERSFIDEVRMKFDSPKDKPKKTKKISEIRTFQELENFFDGKDDVEGDEECA